MAGSLARSITGDYIQIRLGKSNLNGWAVCGNLLSNISHGNLLP
jgi:hypothetical protein